MQRDSSRICHLIWKDHSSLLMMCVNRVGEWFYINTDNSWILAVGQSDCLEGRKRLVKVQNNGINKWTMKG